MFWDGNMSRPILSRRDGNSPVSHGIGMGDGKHDLRLEPFPVIFIFLNPNHIFKKYIKNKRICKWCN